MLLPYRLAFVFLAILVTIGVQQSAMAGPDIQLTYHVRFDLDGSREGGYKLKASTVIAQSYRSERATRSRQMSFSAPYYAPYRRFDVYFRDRYLKSSDIEIEPDFDEDIFLSGQMIHKVTLPPDIRIGDSMAVLYDQRYSSPEYLPLLMVPNVDRLREFRIEIRHPKDVTVEFDMFMPRGEVPYTVDRENRSRTIFTLRDMARMPDLPGFPFNDILCAAHVWLKDEQGTINAASTTEFLHWYSSLFDMTSGVPAAYDTLLADEISRASTPTEKIRLIHDYVRGTIRYIADERGENGIVPRLPGQVLERGYGDCKDRAFLVSAIARRHGLRVDPVLVSTVPRPQFKGTHVWQFNHVICAFGQGDSRMFFDPTARLCEFGNLPMSNVGSDALVLGVDGPQKVRVPLPDNPPSRITITGSLDDPSTCRFRAELRNNLLHGARWILESKREHGAGNRLAAMMADELQKISFDDVEFVSDADSMIVLEGSADLSRYIIRGGEGRQYLPRLAFAVADADLLERENDTFAIYPRAHAGLDLTLQLAAGGIALSADSTEISGGGGSFRAVAHPTESGMIRFEYHIAHRRPYLSGNARTSFLEYYRALLSSRSEVFTLSRSEQ